MKGNLLKIQALKRNSEWCDKDHVMLYACFQLLVDFIEKEKPHEIVDYKYNRKQKMEWKELQTLYRYWKVERPRLEKQNTVLLMKWGKNHKTKWVPSADGLTSKLVTLKDDKEAFRRLKRAELKFEDLENQMPHRLIKIRKHLWC